MAQLNFATNRAEQAKVYEEQNALSKERKTRAVFMNKQIVAIGMVVLVVGLVLIASRDYEQEAIKEDFEHVDDQWNISGYFESGDIMNVMFWPYPDWSLLYYLPGYYPMKIFWVNITDTVGNNYTLFNVTMVPPREHMTLEPPYIWLLNIYEITVTHHGALLVEDKPEDVWGITKTDGIYTINCSLWPPTVRDMHPNQTIWMHDASPPDLRLYRITTEMVRPYTFFLPVGLVVGASGALVSVWGGVRTEEGKSLRRRRSQKRSKTG